MFPDERHEYVRKKLNQLKNSSKENKLFQDYRQVRANQLKHDATGDE